MTNVSIFQKVALKSGLYIRYTHSDITFKFNEISRLCFDGNHRREHILHKYEVANIIKNLRASFSSSKYSYILLIHSVKKPSFNIPSVDARIYNIVAYKIWSSGMSLHKLIKLTIENRI